MISIRNIICCLALIVLTNCQQLPYSESELQQIYLEDIDFKTSLPLSSFAESVELIGLETTNENLFSELRKLFYRNGRFYLLVSNSYSNARILIYSEDGKFLHEINKIGGGPGEYIELNDFELLENGDIKAFGCLKNIVYDSIGNFRHEVRMKTLIRYATTLPEGYSVVRTSTRDLMALQILTPDDHYHTSLLPLSTLERQKLECFLNLSTFSTCKDHTYFAYRHCDTIYSINKKNVHPTYLLDFGKYTPDFSDVKARDELLAIEKKISNKNYFDLNSFLFYSPEILVLGIAPGMNQGRIPAICFYSLKTNKKIFGSKIIDDIYLKGATLRLNYRNLPHNVIGDYLYVTVSASYLIDSYQRYKALMNPQQWKAFKQLYPRLVAICENLSEEDNPQLLRIKLKDITE
ncbi:MAG: 6-bladed beta-propeller [Mediterranea massiliensis]|nr:6-bladed beta-propeller [Mediterranea massiliensis]